jgi:hypothetical protein
MTVRGSLSCFALVLALPAPASATNYCAGLQEPVTCPDGVARLPGDILFSSASIEYDSNWNPTPKVRIFGLRAAPSGFDPEFYLHAEFESGQFGDMVAVPGNPTELAFVGTLPASGGRLTVGKLDRCGNLVAPKYGDFSAFYSGDLGITNALAVDPRTGDLLVSEAIEHPEATAPATSRPFRHRHFRVPSRGGAVAAFWSQGVDWYGAGDASVSGGSVFDSAGNFWQSGPGQESLSVIYSEMFLSVAPMEKRINYDPAHHNQPGYQGLLDMVTDGAGQFLLATNPDKSIVKVNLGTFEREVWWSDDRGFRYLTVDGNNRAWAASNDGSIAQLADMDGMIGFPVANYFIPNVGWSDNPLSEAELRSLATYGVSGPEVRAACQAPVSCSMQPTTAQYGGFGITNAYVVNSSPYPVKGWKFEIDFGTKTPKVGATGVTARVSGNKILISGSDVLQPGQRKSFWLNGTYKGWGSVSLTCR